MSRWIAAAAVVLVLAGEARARAITGNELFETCEDTNGVGELRCVEYIRGVADMMVLVRTYGSTLPLPCLPGNVHIKQLRDIAVRWLEQHPETRHESALGEIWLAFRDAFPCE